MFYCHNAMTSLECPRSVVMCLACPKKLKIWSIQDTIFVGTCFYVGDCFYSAVRDWLAN